jgi:hypothetical protein
MKQRDDLEEPVREVANIIDAKTGVAAQQGRDGGWREKGPDSENEDQGPSDCQHQRVSVRGLRFVTRSWNLDFLDRPFWFGGCHTGSNILPTPIACCLRMFSRIFDPSDLRRRGNPI